MTVTFSRYVYKNKTSLSMTLKNEIRRVRKKWSLMHKCFTVCQEECPSITLCSSSYPPAMMIITIVIIIVPLILFMSFTSCQICNSGWVPPEFSKSLAILLFATREWMLSPTDSILLHRIWETIKMKNTLCFSQFPG